MPTAASVILSIASVSMYPLCAWILIRAIPQEQERPKWVKLLAWIFYGVLCVLLPNLFLNDIITQIGLTVYFLAVGRFLYHKSRTGLMYQLIFSFAMYAADLTAVYIYMQIWTGTGVDSTAAGMLLLILKPLFLMLVTLLMRGIVRRRCAGDKENLKVRGMMLVPVLSMVMLFLYVFGADLFFWRYGYGWLILYVVLALVINGYCLYFWYDVAQTQELKHRLELMQQQSELTHQYYEELEHNYSESRKVIHDIRNHLHAIEQMQKLENSTYLEDVHAMLNSLGLKFYTENRMFNIILNDKLKKLRPEQVECNLGGISLEFVSDLDITTIFANLLDNAVEAAEQQQNFRLRIRGEQIQDFSVVKICNTYYGSYAPGVSGKEGHEGIGFINVRQALEHYHGEMHICYEEGIFEVTVMFPLAFA